MYTRFIVMVFGDNFNPNDVLDKLDTDLILDKEVSPSMDEDGYGSIFLVHRNEFSKEYPDPEYEKVFVDFYEKNYQLLKAHGADDFRIFMDIYYSDQCNFEIFNKEQLKILAKYDVSLPISVYYVESSDNDDEDGE